MARVLCSMGVVKCQPFLTTDTEIDIKGKQVLPVS